jgi:hypothetical protein
MNIAKLEGETGKFGKLYARAIVWRLDRLARKVRVPEGTDPREIIILREYERDKVRSNSTKALNVRTRKYNAVRITGN